MSENLTSVELLTKTLGEVLKVEHNNIEFSPLKFGLSIPDYQRAYEWSSYHVKNLLEDTYDNQGKSSYKMGTIILYDNGENYEIVDGQQRLITLSILLYCFNNENDNIKLPLLKSEFDNVQSFFYLKNTQKDVVSFLNGKQDKQKKAFQNFLINQLTFSVLVLSGKNALDQAYTFFDSLNSKGKGLTDFELLKAHHLMFIPEQAESLAQKHNDYWHKKDEKHGELFSSILRRIRMWSRGFDRDSKADRNDFYEFISAVEPNEIEQNEHLFNRYMQPNVFRSWHRENDEVVLNMKYPQQNIESLLPIEIPQTIEGGDSFFLYAKRYHEMFDVLFENSSKKSSAITYIHDLAISIKNGYLSTAFKAVILVYFDKFGEQRLIEVATCAELLISEVRFRWSSVESTRPNPVRIESTLTRVKDLNLIPIVLNSTISSHVISQMIGKISTIPRESRESPTVKTFKKSLCDFYIKNKSKIKNTHLLEKVNAIYFTNK